MRKTWKRGWPEAARGAAIGATVLALAAAAAPGSADAADPSSDTRVATFAGGCFWCMEPPYDKLDGVLATVSGYTGGDVPDPTYEAVSGGGTGHAEAVRIEYDPDRISYARLLVVFWHNIDPVAVDRQFCDHGSQYRSAIFVHNARQRRLAERSRRLLAESALLSQPIATEIRSAGAFYRAEAYHQAYYKNNPYRYKFYRWSCGRDQRLREIWGELAGQPEAGEVLAPLLEGSAGGP